MQDTPPPPHPEEMPVSGNAQPAPAGEHPRGDALADQEELLRAAELKAAEHHDAWLRAKAETENLRRRAQEDIAKAHKYAADKFAGEMLPVKDSLEAALAAKNTTLENLQNCVELTLKQLAAAVEKSGVTEINPIGEKFDPNRHQAMSTLEDEGEANRVLQVLQKGYALNERVIRPALVIVSRAKDDA